LKISALFTDYDGTLAPDDVPLESSRIPEEIEEPLKRLSTMIPVAIVTSKDFRFIHPRTRFASAWACVSGLEIVLQGGRTLPVRSAGSRRLQEGLEYARAYEKNGITLEEKHGRQGRLLGFSMDWRGSPPSSRFIRETMAKFAQMGLIAFRDSDWSYIDVFGVRPNKGRAVRQLRRLLHVGGNVAFLGDSTSDNSAFEEAEVAICVKHGQKLDALQCKFVVSHSELGDLLASLASRHLSLDFETLRRL
jgi:hydroxymethylpyrimidine pyrophosphatase-like HAD family hydrolase